MNELLQKMHDAAIELAQYASYAEIVGGIGHNRKPIREWCDKVFALHHEIEAAALSHTEDSDAGK